MQTKTKIFANSFSTIELYHVKKKTIAKEATSYLQKGNFTLMQLRSLNKITVAKLPFKSKNLLHPTFRHLRRIGWVGWYGYHHECDFSV
jgi:hypothetical protein